MPVPVITSAYPTQGLLYGYTSVDIYGSNFSSVTRVYFQDANANTYDVSFTKISDTAINLYSPYSLIEQTMQIYTSIGSVSSTTFVDFQFTNQSVLYGRKYAIGASGGFFIEEGFPSISLQTALINMYDVTNALQVTYDVRKFNQLLGLYKDASNHNVLSTTYNPTTHTFLNDDITLNAADFVQYMSRDQVISVGTYSSLYSDFNSYVNSYFAYGNFTPIFSHDNYSNFYDLYQGVFDASSFMHIITGHSIDASSAYVNDVSGSITVHNVNNSLNFLSSYNPYRNRNDTSGAFSQPSSGNMYSTADGFIDGDLIFVPEGTDIKLVLKIESGQPSSYATYSSTNTFNTDAINTSVHDQCYYNTKYGQDTYTSSMNTADLSGGFYYITQHITAPLLIRLKNLSTNPYEYGEPPV